MQMSEALVLVREKFMEEQGRKKIDPDIAVQYERACKELPATMKIAHVCWGNEFSKNS